MNSFTSARRAIGRAARTAATAALSLALAATMMPANAFAAPQTWGGGSLLEENAAVTLGEETPNEFQDDFVERGPAPANGEDGIEDSVANSDDLNLAIPAASSRINETMTLQTRTVAQAESTRSYFLAQTLESTRTVPIVSANLPLDTGNNENNEASQEEEGDDGDDDPEGDDSVGASFSLRTDDSEPATGGNGIAASSTVIGSFTYRGLTYAVEPGGETVAVVAADYNQLPEAFIENQVIVLPSMVTSDGLDYYTVSRIADYAFAAITAAAASENTGGADAPSDIQRGSRPPRYEDQATPDESRDESAEDQATSDRFQEEPDPTHVISSGASEAGAVEKSALLIEDRGAAALSRDDATASEDGQDADASSDTQAQAEACAYGIVAVAIPASITSIGDDAFAGCDTLQYLIVSEDNPVYSSYDGVLYDADQLSLLLIPEGRLGAVWVAPSVATIDPAAFSHCAVETVIADPDSAAYQLLSENDFYNKSEDAIRSRTADDQEDVEFRIWKEAIDELLNIESELTVDFGEQEVELLAAQRSGGSTAASCGIYVRADSGSFIADKYCNSAGAGWGGNNSPQHALINYPVTTTSGPDYGNSPDGTTKPNPQWGMSNYVLYWLTWGNGHYYTVYPRNVTIADIKINGTSYKNSAAREYTGTLTAVYSYYYHVYWDENYTGAAVTDAGQFLSSNANNYVTAPTPTRKNYKFLGWYKDAACTEKVGNGGEQIDVKGYAADAHLYAGWKYGYEITLDDQNGTEPHVGFNALSRDDENMMPVPQYVARPARGGYVFNGYYEKTYESDEGFDGIAGSTFEDENGSFKKKFWYRGRSAEAVEGFEGTPISRYDNGSNIPETIDTEFTLYADWVRDVELDTQIATTPASNQKVHVTWKGDLPEMAISGTDACDPENGPVENHATTPIVLPQRSGYVFNGFWSTPYDESDESKKYYEEKNGLVVPVENKTWDIDQDRLYAHWKYKVYLNLNTFNSDGEIVLRDGNTAFGAAAPTLAATKEQTVLAADGTFNYSGAAAVPVQGGNGLPQNVTPERYSFTAIYGAPIQLPQVTGRTGYGATNNWATSAGKYGIVSAPAEGAADTRISYANASTRTTAAYPFGSGDGSLAATIPSYETGITLFANWDGCATKYTVNLVSQYVYGSGTSAVTFNNTGANTEANPVKLTNVAYDQPLFTQDSEGNTVANGASAPLTAPAYNNTGSTNKDLVFLGFYTAKNNAYSASSEDAAFNTAQGTKYASSYAAAPGAAKTVVSATETVNGRTRAVAFREAPASGTAVTLYALWGWPQVKLTFDLQGGTIDGNAANKQFTLTTNDAMPSATEIGTPVREGYEFAGFWLGERYNEGTAAATKQYYDKNMAAANGHTTWTYTEGGTLYAHWKYRISFDKNLTENDKALLNLDYADPETYKVNVAVALAADGQPVTDAYGNEYALVTDADNTANVEVTAIAGAPVQLRAVHSRTKADGTRTGYNPTITFTADAANANALTITKDATAGYYLYPAWGTDGAAAALGTAFNGAPVSTVNVGGRNVNRVTIFADWTGAAQQFWVKVLPSYTFDYTGNDDDNAPVSETYAYQAYTETTDAQGNVTAKPAFTPSAPYMLVTYDGTVPTLAASQFTNRARAMVTPAAGDGEEHDNLELKGFYSAPNSLYNSQTAGVMHLNAQGVHDGNCEAKFREYLMTALYVESRDGKNATRPAASVTDDKIIPLYARWAQPTSPVVFNYFDERTPAASSKSSDEDHAESQLFSLQKGDKLDVKAAENASRLQNITNTLKTVANLGDAANGTRYGTYEFGGFWTHPFYEGAYTEGGVTRTSKRYFDLNADRTTLVPTLPTWQEDTSVPLYAHWKFTVTYRPNPQDPLAPEARDAAMAWQGANDRLWFVADGTTATDSKAEVPYGGLGTQVVYGSTLTLNKDAANILRTRDFGGTAGWGRTGYTFAGWYTDAACEVADAVAYQNAATGTVSTVDLVPQEKGAANLFANWTQDVYTITLQPTYDGFVYGTDDYVRELTNRTDFNTTSTVSVRFDEPLSTSIIPPALRGFTFLGFYSTGEAAAPTFRTDGTNAYDFTANDAGRLKFYGNTVASGKVAPEGTRWTAYLSGKTSQIYAHYSLNESQITFSLERDANEAVDSTQQPARGDGFTGSATWYYGKKLASELFPATGTFSRYGYKFAGWYYFPEGTTSFSEQNRTYIYKCDEAQPAAVYEWNGSAWTRPTGRSDRWYVEGDMTLHAAWTPITYTVNFYYNSPVAGGSATPDDTMTLTYGQALQRATAVNAHEDGRIPNPAAAPFRFAGWYTAKQQTSAGYWLVNGKDANGSNEADRIKESGVFMPKAGEVKGAATDKPWIDYYAQWHDLEDAYLVFFSGNHGTLDDGYDVNGNASRNDPAVDVLASNVKQTFGASYNLNRVAHVSPDGGWRHLGWVEVDAALIPEALAGEAVPAQKMIRDYAADVAAINGLELTGSQTLPSFRPYDSTFVADADHYGTRYFVAVYGQKGPYAVTLDTNVDVEGETASIGAWAAGTNMAEYSFGTQALVDGAYVDVPVFALPAATRVGYTFDGWERYEVDANGNAVMGDDGKPKVAETVTAAQLGTFQIDPYQVAREADAHPERATLAYHAKWTPKTYKVVLHLNRTDNGNADAGSQTIEVAYNDATPLKLPYPAAMGGGQYFTHYSVAELGDCSDNGILYAYDDAASVTAAERERTYTVKDIIGRIVGEQLPEPADTVDLYAQWNRTISVSMPVQVLIKVDPERGDIITSPLNIRDNGTYPSTAREVGETAPAVMSTTGDASGRSEVEVVSLRYTKGRESTFDVRAADAAAGAKAFLTVYAGQTGLDFSRDGNIDAATGRVKVGEGTDATLGYEPLKIDLAADDAVYPDFSTTAKLHGTYGFSGIQGTTKTLPLHYSLLFQGACANGDPLSALYFRDVTGALKFEEHDTNITHEFAKVTYTIRQAG